MLTRVEIAAPDVDFTKGGINLFSANSVASGVSATSFHAPATRLASAMTLRPLVSVPAIDGNLLSCSLVSPICWTRSAICVVWAASVSVAGPASDISSPSRSFLDST